MEQGVSTPMRCPINFVINEKLATLAKILIVIGFVLHK